MEILLLDLLNIHFDDYRYNSLQLSTKNLYSDKYETIYITDEIKYIQKIFSILNSNHFYYGEYVSPYYVHYVDLDDLKLIIDDLYKIEKKKNKYLKIENFKKRFFCNQLYYNRLFLDDENYSSLEWRVENCYCIYEYGGLKSKNLLIFHDYFQDENMVYDYFEALDDLLTNYEFNASLQTEEINLVENIKTNLYSFEFDDVNDIKQTYPPQSKELKINDIFDLVRYNDDISQSDMFKLLKNYTEDFDSAIVKNVLKDLDFYLFVEKEEMAAQFTYEEVDSAITLRKEKGLEIPYYKRIEPNELTEKQKQNRKYAEEKGFVFNNPVINKEQLLFPFEFMNLYRLKNLLNSNLKQDNEKSTQTIKHSVNDRTAENIDTETNINIDLLKYLSENFTSNDKRFKDLTKYNHIYFHLFPIKDDDNMEDKRALHESYKILIKKEFSFDYGSSQIRVSNIKTYRSQLDTIQKDYYQIKREL